MPSSKAPEKGKEPAVKALFNVKDHEIGESAESGVWIEIKDPDSGKPVGLEILVYGEESSHVRKARNRVANKLQFNQRRGGRRKASYDDVIETDMILAIGASGDWRAKTTDGDYVHQCPDGDDLLPFNNQNARRVYEKCSFIPLQVLDAMEDRANFTQK